MIRFTIVIRLAALHSAAVVAVLLIAAPVRAQLPYLDPVLSWAPADTSMRLGVSVEMGRLFDQGADWTVDRLLLGAQVPLGEQSCVFLRIPYLRFDSGGTPVFVRWPQAQGVESSVDWPGERVVAGFGQFEAGMAGPATLPVLGTLSFAAAAGLPLGGNRLYPFASAGLPLRLAMTRWNRLNAHWWLAVSAGAVAHGSPGGHELDASAFPSGLQAGLAVERSGSTLAWRFAWEHSERSNRRSHVLSVQCSAPWADDGDIGLKIFHEIAGTHDHPAAWFVGVVWRFPTRAMAPAGG